MRPRFQFSIRSLLVLMALVAVLSQPSKWLVDSVIADFQRQQKSDADWAKLQANYYAAIYPYPSAKAASEAMQAKWMAEYQKIDPASGRKMFRHFEVRTPADVEKAREMFKGYGGVRVVEIEQE